MSAEGVGWRDRAACRGGDPELWFPNPSDAATAEAAMSVCGECLVRAQCLREQLVWETSVTGGLHGIYGGLLPAERAEMLRAAERNRVRSEPVEVYRCEGGCGRLLRSPKTPKEAAPNALLPASFRRCGPCVKELKKNPAELVRAKEWVSERLSVAAVARNARRRVEAVNRRNEELAARCVDRG